MKEGCSSYGAGLLQQLSNFVAPPRTSAVVPRSQEMEIASIYGTPPPKNVKIPSGSFLSLFPPGHSVSAPLVSPFYLFHLAFQVCSVVGRLEGVGQKEQKSAIDLVRSPRLLHLSFHCTIP